MTYSSCSCFCLLDRTILICVSCFRAVKIWLFEYNSLILTTGCSTWHLMANNSLRIWELELLLSTKMAKAIRSLVTLKLSYSTVARVIQRFSKTGFTRNRPRKGRSKKLSPCAVWFAWPSSQKEASSEAGSQKSLQTVYWRQPGQEHELLEPCPVVWWV